LQRAALGAGAEIRTAAKAVGLHTSTDKVEVHLEDGTSVTGGYLLCNAAPQVLASLYGKTPATPPDGAQIKINMLLERLPKFRSGIDPKTGFAGTLHIQESFPELEKAYTDSKAGNMPDTMPIELYCHTLTDLSILSRELQYRGCHTLTLFGLHTPASLFDKDPDGARKLAAERALAGLDAYLEEPISSCMTQNADGSLCMEVKSPLDIEAEISLPRGNIFHKNLTFPFIEESGRPGWGVETEDPRVLICGSGAVRGGGVSGIPGHNAAMAILKGS
jgi:phytoene dehydrogenase-like protein